MKPEQQRIAIAEACGWKFIKIHKLAQTGFFYFKPFIADKKLAVEGKLKGATAIYNLPDYLNDLNAMHEVWITLDSKESRIKFHHELQQVVVKAGGHATSSILDVECCVENATAAQRAEAFLKTIGKWDANKQDDKGRE